ncbi:MAG: ATP-binding cassette domain-containing protein, partial [Phycisphaerales bacterium]
MSSNGTSQPLASGAAHSVEAKPAGQPMPAGEPQLSNDVVISAHNLGKRYQIYRKPHDRLKQGLLRWTGKQYYRDFWAVKNVSFEVRRGEAVGVLGRNGAGKSTLLQLIAGTLSPSEGDVSVRGRVAAMLQLGSGFSGEFTGRENVYLAGSILGIPRREMEKRFDDIASFADIGAFMD